MKKANWILAHTHSNKTGSSTAGSEEWTMFATSQVLSGTAQTDYGVLGRFGNTTEVKAVGVNYIIKAKHVGIPSDFIDVVDDAIGDATVDTVADGNMSPVTSNAVAKYGIKFDTSSASEIPDITHTFIKFRKNDGIVTMDVQDANQTGTSIDFDYRYGIIRIYGLTNGSISNTWTFNHV